MRSTQRFGGLVLTDLSPVYVVSFEDGWVTRDLRDVQEAVLARAPLRLAFISEVLRVRPAGALERRELGEMLGTLQARIDPRMVVSVVITDSSIMRGVIRAVNWIHPVAYPLLTVSSADEACDLVTRHLAAERIPAPPNLREDVSAIGTRRRSASGE